MLENLEQRAKPRSILSEEIFESDHHTGGVSFEFLPFGMNGGLVRGFYTAQDIEEKRTRIFGYYARLIRLLKKPLF